VTTSLHDAHPGIGARASPLNRFHRLLSHLGAAGIVSAFRRTRNLG
jgi:hypothetical protein